MFTQLAHFNSLKDIINLNEQNYLDILNLRNIINKHSNYIEYPIKIKVEKDIDTEPPS